MTIERETRDPLSGDPATFLFTAQDNRGIAGRFDYYRGTDDHVFIAAIPDNLGDHYVGGYQDIPTSEHGLARLACGDAYRLDSFRGLVPNGSFLEIGTWIGLVSYSAVKAGYEVSALEKDRRCVDLMRRVGINAVQTDDPATTLIDSGQTYDVIGLWHSIEHISEPWALIEAAAHAINAGGVLVIAAPNPKSAQLRATGVHWYGLDAPRHLHLLPLETYEKIGERSGLVTVTKTTDDHLGFLLERDGWNFELARRFRNIPVLRSLVRLPLWRMLAHAYRRRGELDGAGFTLVMQRPN